MFKYILFLLLFISHQQAFASTGTTADLETELLAEIRSINSMIDEHLIEEDRQFWGKSAADMRIFLTSYHPQIEEKYVRRVVEDYLWSKVDLSKGLSLAQSTILLSRFLPDVIRQRIIPGTFDYYLERRLSANAAELVLEKGLSVDSALKKTLSQFSFDI